MVAISSRLKDDLMDTVCMEDAYEQILKNCGHERQYHKYSVCVSMRVCVFVHVGVNVCASACLCVCMCVNQYVCNNAYARLCACVRLHLFVCAHR